MTHDCCSICLEPLIHRWSETSLPVGATDCGHVCHVECFQGWQRSREESLLSRGPCPCPVCHKPVFDFIRLYISGDTSETEQLKKELKKTKHKLKNERERRQKMQQQLRAMKPHRVRLIDLNDPPAHRDMLSPVRRNSEYTERPTRQTPFHNYHSPSCKNLDGSSLASAFGSSTDSQFPSQWAKTNTTMQPYDTSQESRTVSDCENDDIVREKFRPDPPSLQCCGTTSAFSSTSATISTEHSPTRKMTWNMQDLFFLGEISSCRIDPPCFY